MGAKCVCPRRSDDRTLKSQSGKSCTQDRAVHNLPQKTALPDAPKEESIASRSATASVLNPDAEPFEPSRLSPVYIALSAAPQAASPLINSKLAKLTPVRDVAVEDEPAPEWMSYLSRKFQRPAQATTQFADSKPSTANVSDIIRTSEYLELLRGTQSKSHGQLKKKPIVEKPHVLAAGSMAKAPAAPGGSSSLGQLWLAAVKKSADDVVAEVGGPRTAGTWSQDDLLVERWTADKDVSEAVYWSDCDAAMYSRSRLPKGSALLPSGHRFVFKQRNLSTIVPSYVMQDLNAELDRTIAMLLFRLQTYNDQRQILFARREASVGENQHGRRFIIGLKEVFRRTRQQAVRCLVIAPDINEAGDAGEIDNRVREVLAFAYQNDIPVIFALSRAGLGRALGKLLNISIVGVLDLTGAQDLFQKAAQLASDSRNSWLRRLELLQKESTAVTAMKKHSNCAAPQLSLKHSGKGKSNGRGRTSSSRNEAWQ